MTIFPLTTFRRATPLAILLTALVAALVLGVLPATPAAAEEPTPPAAPGAAAPDPAEVLEQAEEALSGALGQTTGERPDPGAAQPAAQEPTLALVELNQVVDDLSGAELARARQLLARPGSAAAGTSERRSRARTARRCNRQLCVHWRTGGRNGATRSWARRTFRVMKTSWRREVRRLGYDRPRRDAGRRGDGRLDVYLQDLDDGLYGYAAPVQSRKHSAGFMVLDNDYAEFPDRVGALQATAAHELFHVVQFGYDSREDPWFMEATATWMEERVFDAVNDNRQYLRDSQVHRPEVPLDLFADRHPYGNWAFFEYLSSQKGNRVVRHAWHAAGRRDYSIRAVKRALQGKGGWVGTYAGFAGAATSPAATFPEGGSWGRPAPWRRNVLGRDTRTASRAVTLKHLSSRTVRAIPEQGLPAGSRLRVAVDGPGSATAPALAVTVLRTGGGVVRRVVQLDGEGRGRSVVAFDDAGVVDVSVSPVNASTRYRCGRGQFSCSGAPVDDDARFRLTLTAVAP